METVQIAMRDVSMDHKCHLMSLPTEIRLIILRFCLPTSSILIPGHPKPTGYYNGCDPYSIEQFATLNILQVLRINKQILKEASEIIYSTNRFLFPQPGALYRFLVQIGPLNSSHLRQIRVWQGEVRSRVAPMPFRRLVEVDAVKLAKLIIPPWRLMFPDMSLTGKGMALNLYGRARPLIRHLYQVQRNKKRTDIVQIIEVADAYCQTCRSWMEDSQHYMLFVQESAYRCLDPVHRKSVAASREFRRRLLADLRKPENKRNIVVATNP